MMDLKYHHNYFNYCNSFYFYSLSQVGKGIHRIPETLTGYGMCNTESGIRKNLGTGSGIAEENGIRDSIDRCSGFGMVVKRSGTAGSSGRAFTGSEKRLRDTDMLPGAGFAKFWHGKRDWERKLYSG